MSGSGPASDGPLERVFDEIQQMDPAGARTGAALRRTYDQLYDGGRTGRYQWAQLYKTEKTHFGTLIEINLQREFKFLDGAKLDYLIADEEVDAKYSASAAWMLPPEAVGELCIVITSNDHTSTFSIGVVRALPGLLNLGANRDAKKTLNASGRQAIRWLHRDAELPENLLLHVSAEDLEAIMAEPAGQRRINELFRRAIGRRVSRTVVETAAMQLDPMKRIRWDGGARQHLANEGIAIFNGTYRWQRDAAAALGLPEIGTTDYVSTYLAPRTVAGDGPTARISGLMVKRTTADLAWPITRALYSGGSSVKRSSVRPDVEDPWRA